MKNGGSAAVRKMGFQSSQLLVAKPLHVLDISKMGKQLDLILFKIMLVIIGSSLELISDQIEEYLTKNIIFYNKPKIIE